MNLTVIITRTDILLIIIIAKRYVIIQKKDRASIGSVLSMKGAPLFTANPMNDLTAR